MGITKKILARKNATAATLACLLFGQAKGLSEDFASKNFAAKGLVETKYLKAGITTAEYTNEFRVVVTNGLYSIRLVGKRSKNDRTESVDCIFDGKNNYSLRNYSTNSAKKIKVVKQGQFIEERELAAPAKIRNESDLNISHGYVPANDDISLTTLWLSFASTCYYRTNADNSFQPPLLYRGVPYELFKIKFRTSLDFSEEVPGMLRWREDYHDGKQYSLDRQNRLVVTDLKPPLSGGYTNSTFQVLKWMEVMGGSFPQEMELTSYGLSSSGRGVEPRMVCRAFVASLVLDECEGEFYPKITATTRIRETRESLVGSNGPAYYFPSNGRVLQNKAEIDAALHKLEPELRPKQEVAFKKPIGRIAVITLFIGSSLTFFLFFMREKQKT